MAMMTMIKVEAMHKKKKVIEQLTEQLKRFLLVGQDLNSDSKS